MKSTRLKYAIIGIALVATAAGSGYMFWIKATQKYSANTVAGKFEIKNMKKDGGVIEYKLNGKTVDQITGAKGISAEISGVYNINDRTLVIIRWNLASSISAFKYSVNYSDIDKNGNYRLIFAQGIPTNSKSIDVSRYPDKIESRINVGSNEAVGYQKVIYKSDGSARQISEWKWADPNRQKAEDEQARRAQAIQEARNNESPLCKMIRNTFANAPAITKNYQLEKSGCAP